MIRQIVKVFKALNSNAKPWQLSLGVCVGAVLGLTPILNIHNFLFLFIAFIINLNIGIMILSFFLFSGIAYILDPLFHNVGYSVLKAEALSGLWVNVFNCPIALLANLNNSIVIGSLIISIPLTIPLFFLFNKIVVEYRDKIQTAMEKIPILKSLKIVKVYQTLMGERG